MTIQGGRTDNTYVKGQKSTLTAKADANWKFTGWSDGDKTEERSIEVGEDKSYIANFEKIMYDVTISSVSNGTKRVMAGDLPCSMMIKEMLWLRDQLY